MLNILANFLFIYILIVLGVLALYASRFLLIERRRFRAILAVLSGLALIAFSIAALQDLTAAAIDAFRTP